MTDNWIMKTIEEVDESNEIIQNIGRISFHSGTRQWNIIYVEANLLTKIWSHFHHYHHYLTCEFQKRTKRILSIHFLIYFAYLLKFLKHHQFIFEFEWIPQVLFKIIYMCIYYYNIHVECTLKKAKHSNIIECYHFYLFDSSFSNFLWLSEKFLEY